MKQLPTRTEVQKDLRVLALDGGGVRGLSSLMILRRLMYAIEPNDDLYRLPRPCDYFDMICGTSTGGLIAIMLGRLGMGVQECIDAYTELARSVFEEKRYQIPLSKWVGPMFGKARFNGTKLEEAVKEIVMRKTGTGEASMLDMHRNSCKVFVCATRTADTQLAILRSYNSTEEESGKYTIWQAARATSAAPTFFSPICFGDPPVEYVDGALISNNPIRILIREAASVWGSNIPFACILSIGTGAPPSRKLGSLGHQILLTCAKIATQTENTARSFKAEHLHDLVREKKYFRFNVAQGLQTVPLEEWQCFDLIDAATRTYLLDTAVEIRDCAQAISLQMNKAKFGSLSRTQSSGILPPYTQDSDIDTQEPRYVDLSGTASPYFTGRDEILTNLHKFFRATDRRTPQVAVLNGLGGMGKTQIALRYTERHRSEYIGVFFIDATSEQEIKAAFTRIAHLVIDEAMRQSPGSDYDEIAKVLGFSGLVSSPSRNPMVENYRRIVDAVKRWFSRLTKAFLLVFDGADDPAEIQIGEFIPHHSTGDIIITTRDSEAKIFGQTFRIEEMTEDAAVELLSQASHRDFQLKNTKEEVRRIVQKLGRLPLALDQAGGYLATSQPNITGFLGTYEAHAKDMLSKLPNDGMLGYRKSAFTTWEMSFARLLEKSPISARLLELLSFVYRNDICVSLYSPENEADGLEGKKASLKRRDTTDIIEAGFSNISKPWVVGHDPYIFNEAFSSLLKFCLVTRTAEPGAYVIHPVVHLWARERLAATDQARYARDAVLLVARALPSLRQMDNTKAWGIHRRLLPHVHTCWKNCQKYLLGGEAQDNQSFLCALNILATSNRSQGHYREAEQMFNRVLRGRETVLGLEHPDTLAAVESLASIHDHRGSLDEAERLYKRVLAGREEAFGAEHLDTLATVNDLAGVYEYKGNLREAEKLYRRALQGRETELGSEDPDVLATVDDLAGLYDHEGRIAEAEALRLRALAGREKVLGADHPETLATALNLGGLYWAKGKLELAKVMYERACKGREKFFGPQHPQTLFALNSLAGLYGSFGQVHRAEQIYREVMAAREFVLGSEHPDTLWTNNGLGGLLVNRGKPKEAEVLLEQAARGIEKTLGTRHPDTLWVYHNLAIVYESVGRLEAAEELHKRAFEGYKATFGLTHPDTLWILNDLAACYAREGRLDEARASFQEAYDGKLKILGFFNPETLYTANCLAGALWAVNSNQKAEELYTKTLEGMKQVQGVAHPDTWCCMSDLGGFYTSRRRFSEARTLYQRCYDARRNTLGDDHPETLRVLDQLNRLRVEEISPAEESQSSQPKKAKTLPSTYGFGSRRRRDERRWT